MRDNEGPLRSVTIEVEGDAHSLSWPCGGSQIDKQASGTYTLESEDGSWPVIGWAGDIDAVAILQPPTAPMELPNWNDLVRLDQIEMLWRALPHRSGNPWPMAVDFVRDHPGYVLLPEVAALMDGVALAQRALDVACDAVLAVRVASVAREP